MKLFGDLKPKECLWAVTDDKPFLFCGEPKIEGSAYCACHKAMSLDKKQPERLEGKRLTARADFFAGGKTRVLDKVGEEHSRDPVDVVMAKRLSNVGAFVDLKWDSALVPKAMKRAAE